MIMVFRHLKDVNTEEGRNLFSSRQGVYLIRVRVME